MAFMERTYHVIKLEPGEKAPRAIRNPSDLTPAMARGLIRCHTMTVLIHLTTRNDKEVIRASTGIHGQTLTALDKHGLIHRDRDKRARPVWRPTDTGLQLLRTDQPCFLTPAARPHGTEHGYTTIPAHGMPSEPQPIDAPTLTRFTVEARVRFTNNREGLLEREAKTLARCVRNDALAATRAGYDITYELADIRRSLESIRSKRAA